MTKKQALNYLRSSGFSKEQIQAIVGALSSSEKPNKAEIPKSPTSKNDLAVDCISRKAVLDITWQDPTYADPLNVLTEVRDKVRELPSVTPQEPTEKCTWIKYDYRTMCPKEHIDVDNPYWRIPENRMETLKYCPYCGKEIEVEE